MSGIGNCVQQQSLDRSATDLVPSSLRDLTRVCHLNLSWQEPPRPTLPILTSTRTPPQLAKAATTPSNPMAATVLGKRQRSSTEAEGATILRFVQSPTTNIIPCCRTVLSPHAQKTSPDFSTTNTRRRWSVFNSARATRCPTCGFAYPAAGHQGLPQIL
jgi:hypothetical protein